MKAYLNNYKNQVSLLDTLAQSGTSQTGIIVRKELIIVTGNGTDTKNTKQLKGWAKRKVITQKMMLALIDVIKKKERPKRSRLIGTPTIV